MFDMYKQFRMLLATCTASATPGSVDSLVTAVCYDAEGCCDETAAPMSMTSDPKYSMCVMESANAEEKLACTG